MIQKLIASLTGTYLNSMAYLYPSLTARQGLALFCKPFRTPLKDYQLKFLNAADLFSFEHDDVTIQGYRWGNGSKKILFLHGWQSHTFRWKAYIEALLKDDYTIYAIDAPGHGLSEGSFLSVPYYSAVIQQLMASLGRVHTIIAHSVGSFSVLHAFHQQPNLPVEQLILTAPPGEASDFIQFYKDTLRLNGKALALILDEFERKFHKPISYFSSARFAQDVSIPGIIIHDEGDLETPYDYAVAINKNWSNSKLITSQGLGHNLKSKDVIKVVVDYIT